MSAFIRLPNGKLAMQRAHDQIEEILDGPWNSEPDRLEFKHAGFPCLLLRGPSGVWCGYVAMPPGHPWHNKGYEEVKVRPSRDENDYECRPSVHGGLTYASKCRGDICHVPAPGEPDDVFWLGFDCGHAGDICLYNETADHRAWSANWWRENYGKEPPRRTDVYRTVDYAKREVESLAEQAASVVVV